MVVTSSFVLALSHYFAVLSAITGLLSGLQFLKARLKSLQFTGCEGGLASLIISSILIMQSEDVAVQPLLIFNSLQSRVFTPRNTKN